MKASKVSVIRAGFGALSGLIPDTGTYSACFVLADANTARLCYPRVREALPPHTLIPIPAGEPAKDLATCTQVWQGLTDAHAGRGAVLICLGGGMVTDLGGFCASVYKRGIDAVYLPTTLMAMADAAIGGKTGIDFQDFKNQLGTFMPPAGVYIFPEFLKTLPQQELLSGYAEMVKHALLQGGPAWERMQGRKALPGLHELAALIEDSIVYKTSIVNQDPREANLRKILNLGHTAGHALESFLLKERRPVPHGHAVAAGLVLEADIALNKGVLSKAEFKEIIDLVKALFPKLHYQKQDVEAVAALALQDKKNFGASIRAALLAGIGKPEYDVEVTEGELLHSLHWYADQF